MTVSSCNRFTWVQGITLIYIGIDDTDTRESGGTGRLSRALVGLLTGDFGAELEGVTRHQLLQDPRVPCTRKNNASCIGLRFSGEVEGGLRERVVDFIKRNAVDGSDSGVCIAAGDQVSPRIVTFGERAQREFLTKEAALGLAAEEGAFLVELGGTGGGVVGALAAVGLRASRNDGRFNLLGDIRLLEGVLPVREILAAGPLDAVEDETEYRLGPDEPVDTQGKVRPILRGGKKILIVRRAEEGRWITLKGRREESRHRGPD